MTLKILRTRPPVLACLLAVALMLGTGCRTPDPATAPVETPVAKASDEQVQSLTDMAAEYERLQRQAEEASRKATESLTQYQKRSGTLPAAFGPELDDSQRALLLERIKTERAGQRDLLIDLLAKDKEIDGYRAQLRDLDGKLPDHVTAKDGDRHDRIAMNYLIGKGVPTAKAFEIVSQVNLQDALVPGFTVWTYYSNGQFGTWVSQGTATVSPKQHQERLTKMLSEERDAALLQAEALKGTVATLTESEQRAKNALKETQKDAAAAMTRVEELEAAGVARESILKYSIGSKKALMKMKVIDSRLRVISYQGADLYALDVSKSPEFSFDATAYDLKTIKKVTLAPGFIAGTDYRVETEGPFAKVTFLNLAKFKESAFVIVIE